MSEKMVPPNQEALNKKRDEYIKVAFGKVLEQLEGQENYEILEEELMRERKSDEYELSDQAKKILDELVFHVKKQIYADHGGKISKDGEGKDVIEDEEYFEKLEAEYSDDAVEVLIVNQITDTELDESGKVLE